MRFLWLRLRPTPTGFPRDFFNREKNLRSVTKNAPRPGDVPPRLHLHANEDQFRADERREVPRGGIPRGYEALSLAGMRKFGSMPGTLELSCVDFFAVGTQFTETYPIFLQLRLMCLPLTVDDMDDVSPKWCSEKQMAEYVSSMRL